MWSLDRGVGTRTDFTADRSDNLVFLREAVEWARARRIGIAALPRLDLVVDANCALKEIDHLRKLRPGNRTALQEAVHSGIVRLFAPMELDVEVRRNIPELAALHEESEAWMFETWATYKEGIRFFAPEPVHGISIRHANDLPYLFALDAVGGDGILTDDLDIVSAGVPVINPSIVHRPLRVFARTKSISLRMGAQSVATAALVGHVISDAAQVLRRNRASLLLGALAVGVGYLIHRRQISKTGRSFATDAVSALKPLVCEALDRFSDATVEARRSWEEVDAALGEHPPRSIAQSITASMIWAQRPVMEADLVKVICADGRHGDLGQDVRGHVALVLRTSTRFRFDSKGWTLAPIDRDGLPKAPHVVEVLTRADPEPGLPLERRAPRTSPRKRVKTKLTGSPQAAPAIVRLQRRPMPKRRSNPTELR